MIPMRKVILYMHMSLDGMGSGPSGEMDWITLDDDIFGDLITLQNTADAAVFGEKLYPEMAAYWPTVPSNPSSSKNDLEHADWLKRVPKYVPSQSLEETDWENTVILKEDLSGEISRLKQEEGKNIILFGGITIAHTFIKRGLIDEFYLNVNPLILGKGRSFFSDLEERTSLELQDTKQYACGVVQLHYVTKQ